MKRSSQGMTALAAAVCMLSVDTGVSAGIVQVESRSEGITLTGDLVAPATDHSTAGARAVDENFVVNPRFNLGQEGWVTRASRLSIVRTRYGPRGRVERVGGGTRPVVLTPLLRRIPQRSGYDIVSSVRLRAPQAPVRVKLVLSFVDGGRVVRDFSSTHRVDAKWGVASLRAPLCCTGSAVRLRFVAPNMGQGNLRVDDAVVHLSRRRPPPPPSPPPVPSTGFSTGVCPGSSSAWLANSSVQCVLDPSGRRFTVRGVVAAYGVFFGEDPAHFSKYHSINYANVSADMAAIKSYGFNLVRVFVASNHFGYGTEAEYRSKLDDVVSAARSEGLVVEIANAAGRNGTTVADTVSWLTYLARHYKDDPYVWLQPMNEPNCQVYKPTCQDKAAWQSEHQLYVDAIREAGFSNPIVINGINWSWTMSYITDYRLNDTADNLILGAHIYANNCLTFDTSTCDGKYPTGQIAAVRSRWADLTTKYPVMVDEVGANNGGGNVNAMPWADDFTRWSATWVANGGGSGLVAFNWRWPNSNTMTGVTGVANTSTELSVWGRHVVNNFVGPTR